MAALRQNSGVDYAVVGLATFGITTPTFVVAPLLSLFFGVVLGWLPAGGWSNANPAYWILPVVTLALPQVAVIARLVRGSTIEALRSNHVRTARAYGLPTRVVVGVHALRAAMLPAVSYLGPTAAGLLTGSVVVETIFGIPGIGRYFVQGALGRDYTLVMGTVVVIAVFVIFFNLVVDLLYALARPARPLRLREATMAVQAEPIDLPVAGRAVALAGRLDPAAAQPRGGGEHGGAGRCSRSSASSGRWSGRTPTTASIRSSCAFRRASRPIRAPTPSCRASSASWRAPGSSTASRELDGGTISVDGQLRRADRPARAALLRAFGPVLQSPARPRRRRTERHDHRRTSSGCTSSSAPTPSAATSRRGS